MNSKVIIFQDKDIDLIDKSFPKGLKKLEAFLGDIFLKGGASPEEAASYGKEVRNSVLFFHARVLYDFFDQNSIYVSIRFSDGSWHVSVNDINATPEFGIRVEAERHAFLEAFKLLEK